MCQKRFLDAELRSPKKQQVEGGYFDKPILEEKFASILKKALHESVDDAVNEFDKMKQASSCTVPDWMAVKMSSVLAANDNWDGAKRILDAQYLTTGANARFGDLSIYPARNASVDDHQIVSALERILSKGDIPSYYLAKKFYRALIDMRFCTLKDAVLKMFVQFFLDRFGFLILYATASLEQSQLATIDELACFLCLEGEVTATIRSTSAFITLRQCF
ncbi:unnamed protein product [Toxocara canis]|uniref:Uncharacterized protein n=1 Tax=Toxocara canis TaxID=6265 RepID=A0A3P7FL61_TOXCA|nr:unnamed protein product [Toxocara canis]